MNRRAQRMGVLTLTLTFSGWAAAGGFMGTTSDLSAYCLREQCRPAGQETREMFGNVISFQTYSTRRPGILWVGRYQDGSIIESQLEFKQSDFQNAEWDAMQRFVQEAAGSSLPLGKFQECVTKLRTQLRDPSAQGYGRMGIERVQTFTVECWARPLGRGKGSAVSIGVVPAGNH